MERMYTSASMHSYARSRLHKTRQHRAPAAARVDDAACVATLRGGN